MSQLLSKGLKFCSGTGAAAGATYFPDPGGNDASPPANTTGLAGAAGESVFDVGGRDAIIHSIFIDFSGAAFPVMNIQTHAGTDNLLRFVAPQFTGANFTFGPEGVRIPGGFEVVLDASAGTFNWTIAYEIV